MQGGQRAKEVNIGRGRPVQTIGLQQNSPANESLFVSNKHFNIASFWATILDLPAAW